jgi:acetolactate synthase-1/2/3 large subunit
MYTTATALLEALHEGGVSYIFANLGSDHPAIIESLAEARACKRAFPKLITCPNEMVAMSAAHGYAQATGRAQAVLVHVECGTQNLGGAIHNAAKARVPVVVLAGTSPATQEGELRGSRNEFVHWIQDVFDQRGIVRGYMKYDNEIRTGRNVKQLVARALQFAHSAPQGAVYLMAAREVLEEELTEREERPAMYAALAPAAIGGADAAFLARELASSRRPLIVASNLGRNPAAVEELSKLCNRLAIGVIESVPNYVNFAADDPLYQGAVMNEPRQNPVLHEADLVLLIDCDVPWIPVVNRPRADAKVYHIDVDPLKTQMPLWHHPVARAWAADSLVALREINACLDRGGAAINEDEIATRRAHYAARHRARRDELRSRELASADGITPQYLTARIREHLPENSVVLNEGITNQKVILDHLYRTRPATMFTSGGTALGWNGGAAIGFKLAWPEKTIVAVTGDGSYMFSVPSSVHWIARQYRTPFVQIIYNNRGWRSPKISALAVHPEGYASRASNIGVTFDPPPDYGGIAAAAGGAWAKIVREPDQLDGALAEAFRVVEQEKRCAVLDVWLPPL